MRLTAISALLFASTAFCVAQSVPDWTYVGKTGPLYWGRLNSAYQACARGQEQSPLDIRSTHRDKNLQPLAFHFIAGPVTIENTGRGIVVHVDPGSTLTANGIRYQLVELDFHNPSEHPIKGKYSDMEIDMVYHTADGKMAMVAVMLNQDRGFPNALLSTLWTHLPARPGASSKITDMVSMGGFLPADLDYWTYVGSELQPPCTEGVRWYVLQDDLSISRDQFRAFTSLYKINTRGPQDPHGRRIESND